MSLDHIEESEDPRRRRRRTVVRLNTAALWERLALLGRSQNWLAGKAGISPGYLSMLVKEGRAPSGRIRLRMQEVLGVAKGRKGPHQPLRKPEFRGPSCLPEGT